MKLSFLRPENGDFVRAMDRCRGEAGFTDAAHVRFGGESLFVRLWSRPNFC